MQPRATSSVVVAALLILTTVLVTEAQALDVTVRLTIERVRALDTIDEGGIFGTEEADWYAVVEMDGEEFDTKPSHVDDDDDQFPNWEFSRAIDHTRGSMPVSMRIFDHDGGLRGDDDLADIDPGPGRDLLLSVTLAPCSVAGDASGSCGVSLITAGGTEDNDLAEVTFRVTVDEPPSAPGLRVRCLHSPIWPQPTDTVTIQADVVDGSLAPTIADTVEIWVQDQSGPALTSNGVTTLSHTAGPFPGPTFAYGCRVTDGGVTVFSGWRVAQVGMPASTAIPVLFTGPQASRIDVVFIADDDSYTSGTQAQFQSDTAAVIRNAYYNFDIFLANQDKFNFWIALGLGDAEAVEAGCDHVPPSDWDETFGFADVGVLLHTDTFRDCAPGGERLFSSEPTSIPTVRHETGHRPFGLADEYCCDGGYWQADANPNVYEEPDDCTADIPNLTSLDPTRDATDCREFTEPVDWWFDKDWSISDPASNDLMVDNSTPQANDVRRINAMYDACRSANC